MANKLLADADDGDARIHRQQGSAKMTQGRVWDNALQRASSGSDFVGSSSSAPSSQEEKRNASPATQAPTTRRRVRDPHRSTSDTKSSKTHPRPATASKNVKRSGPTPKAMRKRQQPPSQRKTAAAKKKGSKGPIGQRELRDLRQTSMLQHFKPRLTRRLSESAKKEQQLMEIQVMIRQKQDSGDLKVIELPGKGKGVVAGRMFTKGEYVCEYAGDLIEKTEADKREQQYLEEANRHQMDEMMCYMYFLKHRGKIWCVDATHSERIGCLINHSRTQSNLRTKLFEVDGKPHLGFVTIKDLKQGEELLYDYGERDPRTLRAMPWLKK